MVDKQSLKLYKANQPISFLHKTNGLTDEYRFQTDKTLMKMDEMLSYGIYQCADVLDTDADFVTTLERKIARWYNARSSHEEATRRKGCLSVQKLH